MAITGISEDTQRKLLLSVGSHRTDRLLSPMEIAVALDAARRSGTSLEELRNFLHLEDDSVLRRFLSLLTLGPDVRAYVDWKRTDITFPFTAASEIAKLPAKDHRAVADAIIRYCLSTFEVKQLIQLCRRSNRPVEACVEEVVRFRPTVETRHLFIGAVSSGALRKRLAQMSQVERDQAFGRVLKTIVPPGTGVTGRLSDDRFSVVGKEDLGQHFASKSPSFEEVVNERLASELGEP